jgi:predicted transcriptional regulator
MLNRLVAKGILKRRLCQRAYEYLPAVSHTDSRRIALTRFADDFFSGSIELAASTIRQLISAPH